LTIVGEFAVRGIGMVLMLDELLVNADSMMD
jgi:hypothetical protein